MPSSDFILRSRRVVTPSGIEPKSIHVENGKIAAVAAWDAVLPGVTVHDAGESTVMPAIVDTHVHVNEPGRTEWEGFKTATIAAATGGISTLVDMPLNSIPATTTVAAVKKKREAAEGQCRIDVGFWGGVVPGNKDELAAMVREGVLGFKCFLCESGVDEFGHVSEKDLLAAMPVLKDSGVPLLAHCELPGPLEAAEKRTKGADPKKYSTWLDARPRAAEDDAIEMMVRLCGETGARTHVVHHSSSNSLSDIKKARERGLPFSAETCPHYLSFSAEEIPDGATWFKCAPPIREEENREKLWAALGDGTLSLVASDHSPCSPNLKKIDAGDFAAAWGGISGLQLALPVTWTEARKRGYGLADIVHWMCEGPAKLAGISKQKGAIAPGYDADFVVWRPEESFTVERKQIRHKHDLTPWAGRTLFGVVESTYVRGTKVFDKGEIVAEAAGRFLRRGNDEPAAAPAPSSAAAARRSSPTLAPAPSPVSTPAKQIDEGAGGARGVGAKEPEGRQSGIEGTVADFTDLMDLAAERVGGVALIASDDFFAEKENLLKAHAPVWKEHEYTDKGKWMDGWESRRRRDPDWSGTGPGTPFDRGTADHDWCVIRLGMPGVVKGVVIDTAFFRGNFPESASIESAELPNANADYGAYRDVEWEELLPRTKLEGNTKNTIAIPKPRRATHLRLNIFPDGGVARLRVHGTVAPDWDAITAIGGPVDLAAAENGGSVPVCSDMFFGSRHNLVLPGRAPNMSEGWETRRRRGPGNDWTIVELGARGVLRKVEVDTTHFRGNAPNEILLEGLDQAGASVEQLTSSKSWRTLLRKTKAQPHTRHFFMDELRAIGPVTHVRLSVFPCGGVSRLRCWGDVASRGDAAGITKMNAHSRADAITALKAVCGSKKWAEQMADRRPFEDLPSMQRVAEQIWWSLGESDWLEAFSAHPRIGEKKESKDPFAKWSSQEQSGTAGASDKTKESLAAKNAEYEKKYGFVYLICATGKSADEMLSILNERLDSTRERELRTAAEEQANITRLRLRKWALENK